MAKIDYAGGKTEWPGEQLSYLTSGMGKSYVITKDKPDAQLYAYDFMESAITVAVDTNVDTNTENALSLSDLINI